MADPETNTVDKGHRKDGRNLIQVLPNIYTEDDYFCFSERSKDMS